MQALSHFTYHFTNGHYVVCDLQGGRYSDRYVLTDLAVRSVDKEFGPTDLSQRAIDNFSFTTIAASGASQIGRGPW